jgi:hypothetical protein
MNQSRLHARNCANIALACGLGALIGTALALDLAKRFAWNIWAVVIGALVGGIIGWIVCGPREVWRQLRRSLSEESGLRAFLFQKVEDKTVRAGTVYGSWGLIGSLFCCTYVMVGSRFPLLDMVAGIIPGMGFGIVGYMAFRTTLFLTLAFFEVNESRFALVERFLWDSTLEISEKWPEGSFMLLNPVSLGLQVAYNLVLLVLVLGFLVVQKGPGIAWRVSKKTFVSVHSDVRLICFVDAVIGAFVGYHYGSAAFGALTGAALGVVNYWFVSIKWLKLVPKAPAEALTEVEAS